MIYSLICVCVCVCVCVLCQAEDESRYMKMLHDVYSNGDFYFSDGWNLTRTLDAVVGGAPDQVRDTPHKPL